LKNQGAFRNIFNQTSTARPESAFWLKDRYMSAVALQQRTRQSVFYWLYCDKQDTAAALCVRR
jgi:hypothetical protein